MSTPVLTLTTSQPASDAWALMHVEGVRHAVVVRGREIVGVITDRDLGGVHGGRARRGRTVGDLMRPDPVTARPTTSVRDAALLVRERGLGCLPVVERGRLVGIVTRSDLLGRLAGGRPRQRKSSAEGFARAPALTSPNVDKHA
jgi:acetoin utilization protein AcuB